MPEYFSIIYYKVEYICIYPCALEDEWKVVKLDEYVFHMKHFALNNAKELNANKTNVILFNYL